MGPALHAPPRRWLPRLAVVATFLAVFALVWWLTGRSAATPEVSVAEIVSRVEALAQLKTAEYRYRDVIYVGRQTRFFGITTGQSELLFAVELTVQAGIDLRRESVAVERAADGTLFVTLPSAQVLAVDTDERTIEQYFVRERLARVDWLTVSDNVQAVKRAITDDAVERGILDRAERNAGVIVAGLLRELSAQPVQVRFAPRAGLRG